MRVYASAEMTLTDTNDGISVTGIDRYYMASSSSSGITVSSQGWKPDPQETNPVSRYHWSYEVVNYSDGAKIPSKPAVIGVYGKDGKEGIDAVTVSLSSEAHTFAGTESKGIASSITIDIYAFKGSQRIPTSIGTVTGGIAGQLTHSELGRGTTNNKLVINATSALDKGNGTLSIPIVTDGRTFNKVFSWSVAFKGNPGNEGSDGKGISAIVEEYYLSTSKTARVDGEWTSVVPEWTPEKYMWTRNKMTWINPSDTTYSTPVVETTWDALDKFKEGIGDLYLEDKTPPLTGRAVFTNKADDDAVVHVEVEGKSYQHAGSGKNLFIPPRVIDGTMASQQVDNRDTLSPSGENEKFYEISGEPNKQYTFTFHYKHTQGQSPVYLKFFYSDGTDDGKSQGALDKTTWTTKSITSKPNKTVVGIGYHNSESEWKVETLTESIPFSRTVINDNTKLASESYIRKNGVNGTNTYSIEYKWVNGVKTSESRNKKLTSTVNPINEEYVQGTMDVVWKTETYNEPIKFSRTTIDDENVLPADSYIRKNGVNGSNTYSIEYKWVNNVKTSETRNKKLVSTKNPTNEEYVRGTMVVEWKQETSTKTIAFTRTTQDNSNIYPSESYVSREGVNGSITYNLERKWVNGASTSETRNKVEANRKNAVNEIYIRGTKKKADNITFNFTIDKTQTDKWHATPSVQLSNINRAPSSWRTMHLVDDFGAVGDGVTDDSQALKNALQHSNTEPIRLDVGGSEYEYYIPSNGNNRIENYPGLSKGLVMYGNGAVFAPKNERTIDKHEFYLMQIRAEKNAFVETSGFTIDGKHNPQDMFWWISQGKASRASDLLLQKGISYEGSDNIYIHDMTYRNMYGGYIIKLKNYTNVDIQNIRGYSVGGNDNPDSFGTIVHIDGQPDDSFINIDNMVIHGKKSPINPAWVSWIGIVIENGTTQSSDPNVRLADRNTHINVTNSEFYDFESLYHIETQAGNIYWNTDNVKARVMNYTIGAGVRGEIKDRSNHMKLDILPFMRKGLSSGLYHTYRERPSNNLTDENGAFNNFHMYNSIINYLPKEDYVGGVDVHAVAHADSVVANLHNVTLNNVPRWLVANASANLYDTQVNLKQGHNSSYSIFSNQEQYLKLHGTSKYNHAGNWKEASEGSYPPLATNTGFEAPPLTDKIGDILPPA